MPREWLYIDEEGYLNLRPEHDSDDLFATVYAWKETACPHPGMRWANEHIANWSGYRAFQQALAYVGWNFPTLKAELPQSNSGLTPHTAAAVALQELAILRSMEDLGRNTFLVETATGEVLHRHIAVYEGIFLFGGTENVRAGIGPFEFFVKDATTGAFLFRSVHFRQTKIEGPPHKEIVQLVDDEGATYQGPVPIRRQIPWPDGRWTDDQGRINYILPTELHVESRVVTPVDFDYIIAPLERLFRASVDTGNPVRWS